NILSQLAVIPSGFLRGHCPKIEPERLATFARHLIETHLAWLSQSADQVCLVTDVARFERFSDGRLIQKDILEGVALPKPDRSWDWHIAPKGHVYRDRDVHHQVHGYLDFQNPG
ncbi:MAG: hypothetical protein AAF679_08940, partial [Pseudomonadota bacterium]